MCAVQHALHLPRRWHRPQPLRLDRPEDAPLAVAPEGAEHRRVHHAPGRPEVTDGMADCVGEDALGPADLVLGAARPAEPEASMRPAVTADLVTRCHDP